MVIRADQASVLRQAAAHNFEDRMVDHLQNFAPTLAASAGPSGVRATVRTGIERAREYGFSNVGPVRLYLELMFTFGSDFDSDPQFPWAKKILSQLGPTDQMTRADRLYEKTTEYLNCVAGPERAQDREALRRIAAAGEDALSHAPELLETIHSQKCAYVGRPALKILECDALAAASRYAISTAGGNGVILFLMFAFGHGVADDLLYPWVAATLRDPSLAAPGQRSQRLHELMQAYIRRLLNPAPEKEAARG
jgi:hypothetical protein